MASSSDTAIPSSHRLEAVGQILSVEFTWAGDRFQHRLIVSGSIVAESMEGNDGQDWPPSPPVQQLSSENLNGAEVILGVGLAGRSHWSLSVESVDDPRGKPAIKFDWACRTKEVRVDLLSSYRMLNPSAGGDKSIHVTPHESATLEMNNHEMRLKPTEVDGLTCRWAYFVTVE